MNIEAGAGVHPSNGSLSQTRGEAFSARVTVDRAAYNQQALQETFLYQQPEVSCRKEAARSVTRLKRACTPGSILWVLAALFPFLSQLHQYKPRDYLLGDILAGLTVAVVHIPQSLGFALLTSVQPIYGLYSSFWHPLVYVLVGVSPHVSIGPMALISLMVGEVVDRETEKYLHQHQVVESNLTTGVPSEDLNMYQIQVACAVSLLVGIIQVVMSILQLGIVTSLMSISLVIGFTMGAAVHIVTSQIKIILGITIPAYNDVGKVPVAWYRILERLPDTHVPTLLLSLICLVLLIVLKEIINEKYKDKLKYQIPAEMIVVAIATVVSYLTSLSKDHDVKILGKVSNGFPKPFAPDLSDSSSYLKDAFIIAVVSFVITHSMSDTFARKHHYEISPNRELFSQGLCNAIPSFFYSFAGSSAPPRCVLLSTQGAKTQMAGVVTCGVLLLVILVLGKYFEHLPIPALACIIVVALFTIFKQFKEARRFWIVNKLDFLTWLITFASVVFIHVDIGLLVGLLISLLIIPLSGCSTKGKSLLPAKSSDLFCDSLTYRKLQQQPGIRVFRFESNLYFTVKDIFKKQLFKLAGNPNISKKESTTTSVDISTGLDYTLLIIDCSCIGYIDMVGVSLLDVLYKDYSKMDVTLALASCSEQLLHKLANYSSISETGLAIQTYPTIQDAIAFEMPHVTKINSLATNV